jgi:hypothetical protein
MRRWTLPIILVASAASASEHDIVEWPLFMGGAVGVAQAGQAS